MNLIDAFQINKSLPFAAPFLEKKLWLSLSARPADRLTLGSVTPEPRVRSQTVEISKQCSPETLVLKEHLYHSILVEIPGLHVPIILY